MLLCANALYLDFVCDRSMTTAIKNKHSERSLTEAILKTWKADSMTPRYITAIQVNNGAGFAYNRTIDAIVFDTWPSGGLQLHGLEIKVTKADLRIELQNTLKFAEFAPHLDLFSIVAPKGIVDLLLLPSKWGLYVLTDGGNLRARRKPLMLHDDEGKGKTTSRSVFAAFARSLVVRSLSHEATIAAYDEGHKKGKSEVAYGLKRAQQDKESLEAAIASFEKASGVEIRSWQAQQIGEAVKVVLSGGVARKIRFGPNIRKVGEDFIKLANDLENLKNEYDSLGSEEEPLDKQLEQFTKG